MSHLLLVVKGSNLFGQHRQCSERKHIVVALQHKRSHWSPGNRVVALHFGPPCLPECSWVPLGIQRALIWLWFIILNYPKSCNGWPGVVELQNGSFKPGRHVAAHILGRKSPGVKRQSHGIAGRNCACCLCADLLLKSDSRFDIGFATSVLSWHPKASA